jgi:hypothetical protein
MTFSSIETSNFISTKLLSIWLIYRHFTIVGLSHRNILGLHLTGMGLLGSTMIFWLRYTINALLSSTNGFIDSVSPLIKTK